MFTHFNATFLFQPIHSLFFLLRVCLRIYGKIDNTCQLTSVTGGDDFENSVNILQDVFREAYDETLGPLSREYVENELRRVILKRAIGQEMYEQVMFGQKMAEDEMSNLFRENGLELDDLVDLSPVTSSIKKDIQQNIRTTFGEGSSLFGKYTQAFDDKVRQTISSVQQHLPLDLNTQQAEEWIRQQIIEHGIVNMDSIEQVAIDMQEDLHTLTQQIRSGEDLPPPKKKMPP